MGSCCSKKGSENDEVVIELNDPVVNTCVQCRAGNHGAGLRVKSTDKGNYNITATEAGGTVLGSCSLDCDVAYWEVKVVKGGNGVNIGLKKYKPKQPCDLSGLLDTQNNDGKETDPCWLLKREHLGEDRRTEGFREGDIVGVHWDQTDFPMVR